MWSKQKFQDALDEFIDSKLFKDGKQLFNLSAIQFTIANESHKEELINFLIRTNVEQNTSFTALDFQAADFQSPVEDLIQYTINGGHSIIALGDDNRIVGHVMFDDFAAAMNINHDNKQYYVRYKHA
eukprot:300213_1